MNKQLVDGAKNFCNQRCITLGWYPISNKIKGNNNLFLNTATYQEITLNTFISEIFWTSQELKEFCQTLNKNEGVFIKENLDYEKILKNSLTLEQLGNNIFKQFKKKII